MVVTSDYCEAIGRIFSFGKEAPRDLAIFKLFANKKPKYN
tara:strand:+ start:160 stop:279 length:120 start_codon:yes stop_codon:yes gene_type:complete